MIKDGATKLGKLELELIRHLEELKPKITPTTYWEVERDIAEGDLRAASFMVDLLEGIYADDF